MSFAMVKSAFKKDCPVEQRLAEATRIRKKYPGRVPVIVEKAAKSDIGDIDMKKYILPGHSTVGQFVYVIRKRVRVSAEKAIFMFVNRNLLPQNDATISEIYEQHQDKDGFLYVTYSGENTFG